MPLLIALGEYDTGWESPSESLERAETLVARAARSSAGVVVLPEMTTTGFTMDTARAVALDSPEVGTLRGMASRHGVWLIVGIALREVMTGAERVVNVALAIDPSGTVQAVHRKQRLFAFAGEHEQYEPGAQATIVEIHGVRIALFICYELRFPELFRAVAQQTDAMVVIANWPAARRAHWDALLVARAIENQCVVVGVNRTGGGGGVEYDGGSRAFDAWGLALGTTGKTDGDVAIVAVDPAQVQAMRDAYPFLRDVQPLPATAILKD